MFRQILAVATIILAACTMTPHTVEPVVSISAPTSAIGAGHRISLTVVDERPERDVGNRGYDRGAAIRLAGDLALTTEPSLKSALQHMGFDVVAGAPVTLRIEWRDLRFEETQGIITLGREATAALKATVTDSGAVRYERLYRSDLKTRGGVAASTGSAISAGVNSALNDVITQMLADPQLSSALTRRP